MLYAIYGKGGTGKSTLARYLTHRCQQIGSVQAFDADASNGSLTRFYKTAVCRIPSTAPIAVERWLEDVVWPAATSGTDVVLDLGSGAERLFTAWAASVDLPAVAAEAAIPLALISVLSGSKDALSAPLAAFGDMPTGRHIVVKNAGLLKTGETWEMLEAHSVWPKITAAATVLDMPALAVSMQKIDSLNATFADALSGCVKDGVPQLSIFDRQRVKLWISAMDIVWDAVR